MGTPCGSQRWLSTASQVPKCFFFVCLIRWDFFQLLKLAGPQISKDEIENLFTFNNEISCHTKNRYQK